MNISLNWLKEYLDIEMPAEEVADALTSIGLETAPSKKSNRFAAASAVSSSERC